METIDIPLEKFRSAREFLRGKVLKTPLIPIDGTPENRILLKAESLQASGSFKMRGATYCLAQLSEEQKAKGVIAYSTGNHAQAVALAAKSLGIQATIVMGPEALQFKVDATRAYGAKVIISKPKMARQLAESMAEKEGSYLISPFDHLDVITGEGSIGLEILEEVDPAAIFVPVGGGGLISGIAAAVKQSGCKAKVIGVEPELENDAYRTFKTGKRVSMEGPSSSIADAIKIPALGNLTYPLILKYVDDMVTVTEEEIARATVMCTEKAHLFVEPAGALALAAALRYKEPLEKNKPIICLASGGNTLITTLCLLSQNKFSMDRSWLKKMMHSLGFGKHCNNCGR